MDNHPAESTAERHSVAAQAQRSATVYATGTAHPDQNNSVVPMTARDAKALAGDTEVVAIANDPSLANVRPPGTAMVSDAGDADAPASSDDRLVALTHPSRADLADAAVEPVVLPGLYRNGRLVVPPPLKGTREILAHQNEMADREGLERIRNEQQLRDLRAERELVNLPESAALHLNPALGVDRRCARPWTARFAADIARNFYARFHEPLQVNSAVRTISYQLRLQRTNGNAAGIGGELASPHLTGQAIDFGKHGMTVEQIAWMRAYLKPLMEAGVLDVEEEFQQACFHISVYKAYTPATHRVVHEIAHADMPAKR